MTLEFATSATTASLFLMDGSCARKLVWFRLNRKSSVAFRLYEQLYPATHLQCCSRLDCAGLRVLIGQANWKSPAQYELAGQVVQVWARAVRLPTKPALHTQEPRCELPVDAVKLFEGQLVHTLAACCVE